jgi:hypothetical protein
LGAEGRKWWKRLTEDYDFDPPSLLILQEAMTCLDRLRETEQIVASEGIIIAGRGGVPKAHPALAAEKLYRAGLLRLLKALNLDLEPLHPGPGRPPTMGRK